MILKAANIINDKETNISELFNNSQLSQSDQKNTQINKITPTQEIDFQAESTKNKDVLLEYLKKINLINNIEKYTYVLTKKQYAAFTNESKRKEYNINVNNIIYHCFNIDITPEVTIDNFETQTIESLNTSKLSHVSQGQPITQKDNDEFFGEDDVINQVEETELKSTPIYDDTLDKVKETELKVISLRNSMTTQDDDTGEGNITRNTILNSKLPNQLSKSNTSKLTSEDLVVEICHKSDNKCKIPVQQGETLIAVVDFAQLSQKVKELKQDNVRSSSKNINTEMSTAINSQRPSNTQINDLKISTTANSIDIPLTDILIFKTINKFIFNSNNNIVSCECEGKQYSYPKNIIDQEIKMLDSENNRNNLPQFTKNINIYQNSIPINNPFVIVPEFAEQEICIYHNIIDIVPIEPTFEKTDTFIINNLLELYENMSQKNKNTSKFILIQNNINDYIFTLKQYNNLNPAIKQSKLFRQMKDRNNKILYYFINKQELNKIITDNQNIKERQNTNNILTTDMFNLDNISRDQFIELCEKLTLNNKIEYKIQNYYIGYYTFTQAQYDVISKQIDISKALPLQINKTILYHVNKTDLENQLQIKMEAKTLIKELKEKTVKNKEKNNEAPTDIFTENINYDLILTEEEVKIYQQTQTYKEFATYKTRDTMSDLSKDIIYKNAFKTNKIYYCFNNTQN